MKLELRKILILTILGLLLLSVTTKSNQVSGAEIAQLRVDPAWSLAIVDGAFQVAVKVTDVQDLYSWQVAMSFNPAVLEAIDVTLGDFLATQPEGTIVPPPLLNNTHGWVGFGETTLGRHPGVDGSGTLATVTFRVKAIGESYLNITDPVPINPRQYADTILLDSSWPDQRDIPFTSEDGIVVAVKPPSPNEAVNELLETIKTWSLPKGTENSLTSKLKNALHLLDIRNEDGAIRRLVRLMSQAEALRDKKLKSEQADYLISEAQRIIDLINA